MGRFNEESKIRDLLEDGEAVAIFNKWAPGLTTHPMLPMAKGFSLKRADGFRSVIMSYLGMTGEQFDSMMAEILELE